MKKFLKKLFGAGGWRDPRSVKTIGEAELEAMFLEAPGSRLWQGTLVALDNQVQERVEECLHEGLSNEELRTRVGNVKGLLEFRATLEDFEAKARRKESEREKTEDENAGEG